MRRCTSTDAAGAVVFTRRYDAFGNLELGAQAGEFAFTGREWDPETGLYYYRARYYAPQLGRFLSEDPIGFLGGDVNFYAYVGNSPVGFTDPYGEMRISSWLREAFLNLYMMTGRRRPPSADLMEKMKQQTKIEIQVQKPKPAGPPIGGPGGASPSSPVIMMISPCLIAPHMWWVNPGTGQCEPRPNQCGGA